MRRSEKYTRYDLRSLFPVVGNLISNFNIEQIPYLLFDNSFFDNMIYLLSRVTRMEGEDIF